MVELVDFDPDGEVKMVAAMLYPHTSLPESAVQDRVRAMADEERMEVVRAYCGTRLNRRHRPGRALERTAYRFDVLSDYGAFRDLQRHRMLTIEWQPLSPRHGYNRPPEVEAAGAAADFDGAMARSAALYEALAPDLPDQAPYAVALAYRVRYAIQMNAREAMHVLELRTTPQGHPAYRRLCQRMHRLIEEEAGHRAVAEMMRFVDHSPDPGLGRAGGGEAHRAAPVPGRPGRSGRRLRGCGVSRRRSYRRAPAGFGPLRAERMQRVAGGGRVSPGDPVSMIPSPSHPPSSVQPPEPPALRAPVGQRLKSDG